MRASIFLRVPPELKRWLEQDAKRRGLTLTGLIMALLSEYREQKDKTADDTAADGGTEKQPA